jgi:hypothetical protein
MVEQNNESASSFTDRLPWRTKVAQTCVQMPDADPVLRRACAAVAMLGAGHRKLKMASIRCVSVEAHSQRRIRVSAAQQSS